MLLLKLSDRTDSNTQPPSVKILRENDITYVEVSKLFWTNAVNIIKPAIRPIGRYHPRSSSLPHVDTGPTASSIFGTLPGSPFLSVSQAPSAIFSLDLLNDIKPASFQLQFHF
jgi:hypothetical protein